jgi:hypothetical protein
MDQGVFTRYAVSQSFRHQCQTPDMLQASSRHHWIIFVTNTNAAVPQCSRIQSFIITHFSNTVLTLHEMGQHLVADESAHPALSSVTIWLSLSETKWFCALWNETILTFVIQNQKCLYFTDNKFAHFFEFPYVTLCLYYWYCVSSCNQTAIYIENGFWSMWQFYWYPLSLSCTYPA